MFLTIFLPIMGLWYLQELIPGPYTQIINRVEFNIEFIIWWVGLGILSSIGLGSGLQSSVLFLLPHVVKVYLAATTCKTVDFESVTDIWFRSPKMLFKCPTTLLDTHTPVTFTNLWIKIYPACFLMATGAALGEIPPYWITRAARLAAIKFGENEEIPEELDLNSKWTWINSAKAWMIRFLKKHGFLGVMFMASYPNLAFDLCGICCGHFLMPFSTFILATFIGKAVIRNTYQSLLYIALCSEHHLDLLIEFLQYLAPDALNVDKTIKDSLLDARDSFQALTKSSGDEETPAGPGKSSAFFFYWQMFTGCLFVLFTLSCVSHCAQFYQMNIDNEQSAKLRLRIPLGMRAEYTCSTTGKLNLPPPSSLPTMANKPSKGSLVD